MASESLTAPTLSDDIVAIMGVIEAIRATIAEATYTLPIVDIRKVRWPSEPSFPVFKMTYDARAAIKVIDRTLPPRTAIPAYIGEADRQAILNYMRCQVSLVMMWRSSIVFLKVLTLLYSAKRLSS